MSHVFAWFRGVRGKLFALMAFATIAIVAVLGCAVYSMTSIGKVVTELGKERIPITQNFGDARASIHAMPRYLWLALATDHDEEKRKEHLESVEKYIKQMDDTLASFEHHHLSDKGKEQVKHLKTVFGELKPFIEHEVELLAKNNPKADAEMKAIALEHSKDFGALTKTMLEMVTTAREVNAKIIDDGFSVMTQMQRIMNIVGVVSIVLLLIVGFMTASRLARTLASISNNIAEASTQTKASSQQLSSASQQLSSGATEAASALEETVSSLEELSSMVKLNADNAKQAAGLSQGSTQSAENGASEIRNLIESMRDISQSSKKIEEIINVIDDIAFQTNLLALNAAVEAARAGEQGKGFAVVAEAVRNLAQRSASAAKDITSLIKDSVAKTEHGARVAGTSGNVLNEIVQSVKKVAALNGEIASASQEQANGISQISKAMNELDTSTQQNAAASEEVSASAEELSAQGNVFNDLVAQLVTIVDGATKGHNSGTTSPATDGHSHAGSRTLAAAPLKKQAPKHVAGNGATEGAAVGGKNVIPFDEDVETLEEDESKTKIGSVSGF